MLIRDTSSAASNFPTTPYMPGVRTRLANGESAQAILAEVIEFIIVVDPGPSFPAADCIMLLAENGACVATDQPGCAFENLICKPTRPRPRLIMDLAGRLAARPGELPYHVLAKHALMRLSDSIIIANAFLSDINGARIPRPDIQSSLRARDSLGRTVSHWLWAADGELAQDIRTARAAAGTSHSPAIEDADSTRWLSWVEFMWTIQGQLQDMGAGLDLPDHQGRPALDLCLERIEAGEAILMPEFHVSRMVEATRSQRAMQAQPQMQASLDDVPRASPRF